MQTIDVGPLFFAPARFETNLARLPFVGTLPSQETEPPYRSATVIFARIPFTKFGGFAGWWGKTRNTDPDSALMEIIAGHGLDLDDVVDDEDKRTVREIVANHTDDWDDEWKILNMLDLDS